MVLLQVFHLPNGDVSAGASSDACGQLAALLAVIAHVALVGLALLLIVARSVVGAGLDAHFAADALVVILLDDAVVELGVGLDRARLYACGVFAVVARHREEGNVDGAILTNARYLAEQDAFIQLFLALACNGARFAAVAVLVVHPETESHDYASFLTSIRVWLQQWVPPRVFHLSFVT